MKKLAKKVTANEQEIIQEKDKKVELQNKGKELALLIDEYCSESPEKNASLKSLEQVLKYALISVK